MGFWFFLHPAEWVSVILTGAEKKVILPSHLFLGAVSAEGRIFAGWEQHRDV